MEALIWILLVLVAALAVILVVQRLLERVTVFEFERGLRYEKGRLTAVLDPGQYWIYRRTTRIHRIDVRPRFLSIAGQEVLSADSVSIRVSLAAEFAVADPAKAITSVDDYEGALYLSAQIALRELVGGEEIDALLERRVELGQRLLAATAPRVQEFGLELRALEIKDIMFPGPLKRSFARAVEARKEGLAALERARGESAALRNLANAARVVEGNPALLHLRLLQEIGTASGHTIVLGLPGVTTPIPVRQGDDVAPHPELETPED